MTPLLLAQLAARWGQALAVLLLSLVATAAAVGAVRYADAIDRTAIEHELAAADRAERVVSLPRLEREWPGASEGLAPYRAALRELTAFRPVTTVEIFARGLAAGTSRFAEPHPLLARDGFCRRVVYRDGRCPVGTREAALPAPLAAEFGIQPGDPVELQPVVPTVQSLQTGPTQDPVQAFDPDGPPATLTVVGTFEARNPDDPYWRPPDHTGYRPVTGAIFTNRAALAALAHQRETVRIEATLRPEALTPGRLPELRRQIEAAGQRLAAGDTASTLDTNVPQLLDRIRAHGSQARSLLPIAAAPLVALCWLVVHLAVGHGAAGRRHEIGVVALRGARWRTRAAAASTEALLPALAGVPAGIAVAPLLVRAVGPVETPITVDGPQLLAAGLAVAGTVIAALLALGRELAVPPAQLLRRVAPRRRLPVAAAEVLTVVLAGAVLVQLHAFGGELVGLLLVAPAVVMLAAAVLVARLLRPVIGRAGRWSLRRGWLGPALAALYLARRPGATRLLVVLALVLGMLGFAVASAEVASRGRATEAARMLGAARVLDVQETSRPALLRAVRAADPTGRYAMAAVSVRGGDDPPRLAVDTPRLPVALWSDRYGADLAEVAARLRPAAPEPVQVRDGEVVAELGLSPAVADRTLTMSLVLAPPAGGLPVVAEFGPVAADQPSYRAEVSRCRGGCRLVAVTVVETARDPAHQLHLTGRDGILLRGVHQRGREVLPAGWLTDPDRWRHPERSQSGGPLTVVPGADGLLLAPPSSARLDLEYSVLPVAAPYPLPVVSTVRLPRGPLLSGIDGALTRVAPQARLAGLPGLTGPGVMMDLEYADRLSVQAGPDSTAQVWLARDAPDRIVDRLRDHGLVITGAENLTDVHASLDRGGAALALRFHLLAGGLAVVPALAALALVVAVDRGTWGRALRALRVQGLRARTSTRAALWSYGGLVLAGAVAGALVAAAAWLATGDRMPFGLDQVVLTAWPRWVPVLPPWTVAVALLLAGAVAGAGWLGGRRGTREVGG